MSFKVVCVTGGSGFIALHVVKQLLESGRNVHATVRQLSNTQKVAPFVALSDKFPGQLRMFEADLTAGPDSFALALEGCDAVLHTASPFYLFGNADEVQEKLIKPAVEGTVAVLEAASRVSSIKRVVVTSSFAAIVNPTDPTKTTYSEEDWNTFSNATDGGVMGAYCFSKAEAERAAWKFVEDKKPGFTLATLCPPYVFGKNINEVASVDDLNTSSGAVLRWLKGEVDVVPDGELGIVDVEDLARAHILAMEKPEVSGRFFTTAGSITWNEFATIMREEFPSAPIPTTLTNPDAKPANLVNKKSIEVLGLTYRPVRETIKAQADALIRMGLAK